METETKNVTNRSLALVTGASSGIGAVYAQRLAARGYDLILVARRKDRLEKLLADLNAKYLIEGEALAADLSDDGDRARVEDRIRSAPNLEFLVNNAGFGTVRRFWKEDLDGQDRMHRLHVLATMRLTHIALQGMIARGKGFIVNVSSVSGFTRGFGGVSYSSTKAWMNRFTENLAGELRGCGADVRVQALCPGFTYTEFHDLINLDRSFVGKSWWMTPESVVDGSLAGLERKNWLVIPGLRYKLIVFALEHLPRWAVRLLSPKGAQDRSGYVRKEGSAGRSS
jgi:short-subunit dehydrogenase